MAEDNKMKRCPVTLQPDIEELLDWNNYSADDFDSASQTEKKDFIQERQHVIIRIAGALDDVKGVGPGIETDDE